MDISVQTKNENEEQMILIHEVNNFGIQQKHDDINNSSNRGSGLLPPYNQYSCGKGCFDRALGFPLKMVADIVFMVLSPLSCIDEGKATCIPLCMMDFLFVDKYCNRYCAFSEEFQIPYSENEYQAILTTHHIINSSTFNVERFKSRDENYAINTIRYAANQFANKQTKIRKINSFSFTYTSRVMEALVDLIVSLPLVSEVKFDRPPQIGSEEFLTLIDGLVNKIVPSRLSWLKDDKNMLKYENIQLRLDIILDRNLRASTDTFTTACRHLETAHYPLFISIVGSFNDAELFDLQPFIDDLMKKNPYVRIYTNQNHFSRRINDLTSVKLDTLNKIHEAEINAIEDDSSKYNFPNYCHCLCGKGCLARCCFNLFTCVMMGTAGILPCLNFKCKPYFMTDFLFCDRYCDNRFCCGLELIDFPFSKSEIKMILHSNAVMKNETFQLRSFIVNAVDRDIDTIWLINAITQELTGEKNNIKKIDASRCSIDDKSIKPLVNLIIYLPMVNNIILAGNRITTEGFIEFMDQLIHGIIPSRQSRLVGEEANTGIETNEKFTVDFQGNYISLNGLRLAFNKLETFQYRLHFNFNLIYPDFQRVEYQTLVYGITQNNHNITFEVDRIHRFVPPPQLEDMQR